MHPACRKTHHPNFVRHAVVVRLDVETDGIGEGVPFNLQCDNLLVGRVKGVDR